jgi:subfamily B ATP-binding cassette protein MsbA
LKRLLGYCVPYWRYYAGAVACGAIKFLTPVGIAWVFGEAVNVLTTYSAGTSAPAEAWRGLLRLFGVGVGIMIINPLPVYLRSYLGQKGVQLTLRDLRLDLYAHIQRLSHSFFEANRSGAVAGRVMNDIETVQPFLGKTLIQMWMNLIVLIVVFGYFFSQSPLIGLLSVSLVPIQLFILLTIGRKTRVVSRFTRAQMATMTGEAQERLAAPTVIKSFTLEDHDHSRFEESSEELVALGIRRAKLGALNQVATGILNSLAPLGVILVGGYLGIFHDGALSIGLLVQFVMMQGHIYNQFQNLSDTLLVTANALGATDRIFEILTTEADVRDRPDAIAADGIEGAIRFDTVRFAYPSSPSVNALHDLTLTIEPHTTVAVVGPSGAGKSTLFNLLNRFYDVNEGCLSIDGVDIRDYALRSLRSRIGMVPQESLLFSCSVLENVRIGRPEATMDEVMEAAANAGALEFIEELPEKFDTLLGERGTRLSGGQRQRIAIARAFLKDPAILLLDEATSALDSESERAIQEALERLMHNRTSLVIAHRLSTVVHCSTIAVFHRGRLVETGSHDKLVAKGGVYAGLARLQFGVTAPGEASDIHHHSDKQPHPLPDPTVPR